MQPAHNYGEAIAMAMRLHCDPAAWLPCCPSAWSLTADEPWPVAVAVAVGVEVGSWQRETVANARLPLLLLLGQH